MAAAICSWPGRDEPPGTAPTAAVRSWDADAFLRVAAVTSETVPATTDETMSPLGSCHAERDGPGRLHQVRRLSPPRLPGSPARRGRPRCLGRCDPRHP